MGGGLQRIQRGYKSHPRELPPIQNIIAPGFKDKTRYTSYVSPESQISHIATNKGNIEDNAQYITYLV